MEPAPSRLGWLDALRGIAALVVVFDHSSYAFMAQFRHELMPVFNTSRYGIMVFFLVSGYLIPASLERRGSIRRFWIGRVFRIYPLCVAVVALVLTTAALGVAKPRDTGDQNIATVALAHTTMLQELLGTPNLLIVLWTLSYEMAFYLLIVGLFTIRRHHHSATIAIILAVAAAATAAVALPVSALSGAIGTDLLIVLTTLGMAVAIGCACTGSPALRVFGGVLGGLLALTLVAFNGTVPMWEGLTILAVMFLGTAIHRAEHHQARWRHTAWAAAAVVTCGVGSAAVQGGRLGWIVAFVLAVLTFATGLALRHRRIPRWLVGLGTISYSVYLVHPALLAITDGTIGRWQENNLPLEVAFCLVLLPLCVLTYRYIEAPGQKWGQKLANRAERTQQDLTPNRVA